MRGIQKPIKDTLRYKNMVANLKWQPAYKIHAALVREIASGTQWRMDAVLDVLAGSPEKLLNAGMGDAMRMAAMFGRLGTVQRMAQMMGYDKTDTEFSAPVAVVDAFHTAVIHGHLRVADYLYSLGARSDYQPRGMEYSLRSAVAESSIKKIEFLMKRAQNKDEFASYGLYLCVGTKVNQPLLDYFLKQGAWTNVGFENSSAFLEAVRGGHFGLVKNLLERGVPSMDLQDGTALDYALRDGNEKVCRLLVAHGAKVNAHNLNQVLRAGNAGLADLLLPHVVEQGTGPFHPVVQAAYAPNAVEMIGLCEKHGKKAEPVLTSMRAAQGMGWKQEGYALALHLLETYVERKSKEQKPTKDAPKP